MGVVAVAVAVAVGWVMLIVDVGLQVAVLGPTCLSDAEPQALCCSCCISLRFRNIQPHTPVVSQTEGKNPRFKARSPLLHAPAPKSTTYT